MKISRKKITASTEIVKLPEPFDQFYQIISDEALADYSGYDGTEYPVEEAEGYEFKHIAWAIPKPEYEEMLADQGLEYMELAQEGDDEPRLVYVVNDRVYPLDESDLEMAGVFNDQDDEFFEDIEESTDVECSSDAFKSGDRVSVHFGIWDGKEGTIFSKAPNKLVDGAEPGETYFYVLLDGEGYKDDYLIFEQNDLQPLVEACDNIKGAVDTGLDYWYYTRHGIGPGMMPRDCQILDWYEEGYKTWIKLNKMLTTEELNYYDIQEEWPPVGAVTHNGDEITACDDVEAATLEEMQKAMDEYTSKQDEIMKQLDGLNDMTRKKAEELAGDKPKKKFGLFSKKPAVASTITKIAEDDDSISYVISSDDVEEDFMEDQPEQEYSSAETAINGKQGKLPAVFSKAFIPNGALVLDYGGGTVESEAVAQKYLDQFEAKEMLYDPFNQTPEHNRDVIRELKSNGGADVAVCSNVLNVIKEQEVRLDLLKKISKLLKPGATAYISVYEGSGKDNGRATQKGKSYQNNKKLGSYLEEVQEVFPEATRKGAVIIAPNTSVAASTDIDATTDIDAIDLDQLKKDIEEGCIDYLCGPEGGFKRPGEPREDKWDMFADEMFVVEVKKNPDSIVIEVRAELSYDGMMNMSAVIDEIVSKYDPDAYFEQVEPGIMECWIWSLDAEEIAGSEEIEGEEDITAGKFDRYNDEVIRREEDRRLDPPEYDEPESLDPVSSTFAFDIEVEVDDNYIWKIVDGDPLYHADPLDDFGINENDMKASFEDLIEWHVPAEPGKYALKGKAKLVFSPDIDGRYALDTQASAITDLETINTGKVESSTKVEAAMTEEELDDAILNNKPFDLESFKKWKNPVDPDAVQAQEVKIGDVIDVEDASEVNLGTVVEVLAINDPAESWIDYTFRCKVIEEDGGMQNIEPGSIIDLHFAEGEPIGYSVSM